MWPLEKKRWWGLSFLARWRMPWRKKLMLPEFKTPHAHPQKKKGASPQLGSAPRGDQRRCRTKCGEGRAPELRQMNIRRVEAFCGVPSATCQSKGDDVRQSELPFNPA